MKKICSFVVFLGLCGYFSPAFSAVCTAGGWCMWIDPGTTAAGVADFAMSFLTFDKEQETKDYAGMLGDAIEGEKTAQDTKNEQNIAKVMGASSTLTAEDIMPVIPENIANVLDDSADFQRIFDENELVMFSGDMDKTSCPELSPVQCAKTRQTEMLLQSVTDASASSDKIFARISETRAEQSTVAGLYTEAGTFTEMWNGAAAMTGYTQQKAPPLTTLYAHALNISSIRNIMNTGTTRIKTTGGGL